MKRTTTLPMLLTLTAVAGFAVAQPAKKEKQDDKNLLRGPDVRETTTTNTSTNDARPQLTEEQRQKMKQRMFEARPIEMRELVLLTRARGGNNALELTDAQREQIRAIQQEYREKIRLFQQEHQEKIIALRAKVSEETKDQREEMRKRRSGEQTGAGDAMEEQGEDGMGRGMGQGMGPGEGEAARELREFISSSPPAQKAMKAFKSVLTEEQYATVEDHVFKLRMRAMQRRGNNNARPNPARRNMDPEQVRTQRREQDRERDMERGKQKKKDDGSDG